MDHRKGCFPRNVSIVKEGEILTIYIHVQPEELHEAQLGKAGLVAQICADVRDIMKDPGYQRHGYHSGAGAVFDNSLGLSRLHALFQQVQS
jgi:hypothetical protein